jgi:hypothetical protein
MLVGERLSLAEEVEGCHGVLPTLVPEEAFAEAHQRLDAGRPGGGALPERYQHWLSSQVVPPDKFLPALLSLTEELRERTIRGDNTGILIYAPPERSVATSVTWLEDSVEFVVMGPRDRLTGDQAIHIANRV